jgi:hypothetical protein
MSELRLTHGHEWAESVSKIRDECLSEPERELRGFIHSMASLVGPGADQSLTELWLDELACMDCIPDPHSAAWRSVSLAASVKLASRMIASLLSGPCL